MKKKLIYLASPYYHSDKNIREERYVAVCKMAAKLMKEGNHVLSPIAHSHSIAEYGELPGDWKYWESFDRKLLSICDEVLVLNIENWKNSKGIKAELEIAKELNIPISYIY